MSPGSGIVKVSFLTGELHDMKVWERVEKGTGNIVEQPKLRATLKLKNTSESQAARPIAGTIEYVDAEGKAIRLADNRGDATFKFYSYQERLDPGLEAYKEARTRIWCLFSPRTAITIATSRRRPGYPSHPARRGRPDNRGFDHASETAGRPRTQAGGSRRPPVSADEIPFPHGTIYLGEPKTAKDAALRVVTEQAGDPTCTTRKAGRGVS